ncbi:ATP-binding protein [Sphingomonas sp. EC-HK361]|uniref:ATP-binding protein n=1 Tax=Sphingomonas sp. EC-HK361 TaxID=2038397 RepID=UPI00125FCD6F|nr:ATP-binding protein [Sphingomonas sp. EC-HK361]
MRTPFPFSAIVGQDEMKLALLIAAVDARIGGVMVFGDRGTGKSTAVRALAALLPDIPAEQAGYQDGTPRKGKVPVPFVDLPLGATEDRVLGALDLERALGAGEKAFEPGLLARANGGFLYIDEINLLEDHIVDLLLDVAASGENVVEREGLSVRHPARFVLVGSGNPEEGELRPQLLDRFGLSVDVRTPQDVAQRVEILKRCDAYERDGAAFAAKWRAAERKTLKRLARARSAIDTVVVPDSALRYATRLCMAVGADGLRGELTLMRAARALAALDGMETVAEAQLSRVAPMALRHRLRRNPLDETGSTARIERAMDELAA